MYQADFNQPEQALQSFHVPGRLQLAKASYTVISCTRQTSTSQSKLYSHFMYRAEFNQPEQAIQSFHVPGRLQPARASCTVISCTGQTLTRQSKLYSNFMYQAVFNQPEQAVQGTLRLFMSKRATTPRN